ncbi:MAG: ATP-binding cassette domain-containing protein [Bacteroidetes bacterium]|nr:MAG: ATP-binding cassette domain-containing protein [Bacteroidota bacterium]
MSLIVQDLSKKYGKQLAIDNLSFSVNPGEIVGFLGPNGAGKSTTMKIITGYLPPSAGTVHLGEYNVADHPMEIRRRVGYLPEHNPLYLEMYVHEYLSFTANIHGISGAENKARVAEVIHRTGLEREQHKKIGALSKGYRQRVGLSQAMIHEPELLILDEPTTGLDPNQIVDIRKLIQELGKEKTVIFSSHILSEVEAIADRIIIINQGKLVTDVRAADLNQVAGSGSLIELEVENPGLDFSTITALGGFREITSVSPTHFRISSAPDSDLRKAVFSACVSQNNPILTLSRKTFSLEDTFRYLTSGSAQRLADGEVQDNA